MVSVNEASYGDLIMRLYAANTENELSALMPEFDAALAEFALAAKHASWLKEAYALRAEELIKPVTETHE